MLYNRHGEPWNGQHRFSVSLSALLTCFVQPCSRAPSLAGGIGKPNRGVVTTRAGPTTSQYVFAFVLPLSLIAFTVFTSVRIADKLDRDYLEEVAINQAIRETDEDDEDEMSVEEKSAVPRDRSRNRPKREV